MIQNLQCWNVFVVDLQFCFVTIKRLLSKLSSVLAWTCRVLIRVLIMVIDATVNKVQIVHFDVATTKIIGLLILFLYQYVGIVHVVKWTAGFVQIVCPSISYALTCRDFVFIVFEFVIITRVYITFICAIRKCYLIFSVIFGTPPTRFRRTFGPPYKYHWSNSVISAICLYK